MTEKLDKECQSVSAPPGPVPVDAMTRCGWQDAGDSVESPVPPAQGRVETRMSFAASWLINDALTDAGSMVSTGADKAA